MSERVFYVPSWGDDSFVIPYSGWSESQAWHAFDRFIREQPDIVTERTSRALPRTWRARKATYVRLGVTMRLATFAPLAIGAKN